jgi:hypothetical protein
MRHMWRSAFLLFIVLGSIVLAGCEDCNCGCNDDKDDKEAPAEQTQSVNQPSSCNAGDTVKCPNSDKVRTCSCSGSKCDFSAC